jgi:hypothetical protein
MMGQNVRILRLSNSLSLLNFFRRILSIYIGIIWVLRLMWSQNVRILRLSNSLSLLNHLTRLMWSGSLNPFSLTLLLSSHRSRGQLVVNRGSGRLTHTIPCLHFSPRRAALAPTSTT